MKRNNLQQLNTVEQRKTALKKRIQEQQKAKEEEEAKKKEELSIPDGALGFVIAFAIIMGLLFVIGVPVFAFLF